jgi:hemoglobin
MAHDIENQADIEKLVRTFYNHLIEDPFMSPFFEGINFEHHFPRMFAFWSFILLNTEGFGGNVFDAHRRLAIDERHFERWISTFHKTVDELFIGNTAEKAKNQASVIGLGFQSKMKYLRGANEM